MFFNFDFNFGISQGTFKYCWMSGVRRVLKLIPWPSVPWQWAPASTKLRLRSTFLFFLLNSPRPGSPGSEGGLAPDLVSEAGELVMVVTSCDLSEMGERIWSLLMILDILVLLTPAEAGLRSRDEDEVWRSEARPELGTPLVTLSLMLSPAGINILKLGKENSILPSLVFDSTLSMLEMREEQPELAILLSTLRKDLGWNTPSLGARALVPGLPDEEENVLSSCEFLFRSTATGAELVFTKSCPVI